MGKLIDGTWHDVWYETEETGGHFVRKPRTFRDRITAAGGAFPAARGRYHLYVSLACPWAHRTLIFRTLKRLDDVISVSIVEPLMLSKGWYFSDAYPDHLYGATHLHALYTRADPKITTRVTVPVLWDKETQTIVNNESSEIIRMFNSEFDAFTDMTGPAFDFYPEAMRDDIDAINSVVYDRVNNGVYKAGFATTQGAYETAAAALFTTLDALEARLQSQPYLCGHRITEADWRLFTTLVRFDAVYHGHFKCNIKRIQDYPRLLDFTRRLYGVEGVADTFDIAYTKLHYYGSHESINPSRVVPMGPDMGWLTGI